jgi:glycosyl transferase family 25
MKIYVINLARRTDRLERIDAQLCALDLPYERIDAVDAQTVSDRDLAPHWTAGTRAWTAVTRGAKCCYLSHARAWRRLVGDGDNFGVILEDDARLHADAAHFLSSESWIPADAQLIKLEVNFLRRNRKVLIGRGRDAGRGYELAPLLSKHMGSGGYVLSRAGARTLLDASHVMAQTVDAFLFNPGVSPVFSILQPLQLNPAVIAQSTETGMSDLAAWRIEARARRPRGIRRALAGLSASLEEFGGVSRGALALVMGKARLVEISFGRSATPNEAESDAKWAVRSPFV